MPRADMARDGASHNSDRPRSSDENVLAHKIEGERGMDRIAERIENRAKLVIDVVG